MAKFHKNESVTKIMAQKVMTCSHGTKISELAEFFKTSAVKHVPVVDKDRRLCGIVSESDIRRVNYADALNKPKASPESGAKPRAKSKPKRKPWSQPTGSW